MKVFRRPQFLKLPEGTIYAKGKKWYFGGLQIKCESLECDGEVIDWYYADPQWIEAHDDREQDKRLTEMLEAGASYPMQSSIARDGCFENDDLFLVFESADLEILKTWVESAITVAKLFDSAPTEKS